MPDDSKAIVTRIAPQKDFGAANPAAFANADPEALRQLGWIETRTAELKERLGTHLARHEASWTAREATSLLAKHSAPKLVHPPPRGVLPDSLQERVLAQARRNVRARATQRLTALNMTKLRMQEAVIRPAQTRTVEPDPRPTPENLRTLRRKGP